MSESSSRSIPKTPGQLIADELEKRGWTQRLLATILGVDETGINKIVSGKRDIDAAFALAAGEVLGVTPELLLDLQKQYELARARVLERPDPNRATRAILYGGIPVLEMMKRGWIDARDIRDTETVDTALTKFFGVQRLDQIEILPHAAKKTHLSSPVTPVQLAWLYRVREIAKEMLVGQYEHDGVASAVHDLRSLLVSAEAVRKIPRILSECGVRLVIVESLPSAKIDGVCFWLDKFSPVIGLSLRYDRIDNLWFVLRHEIEHVLQLHGQEATILDAELEGDKASPTGNISEEELIANRAAAEFCVPASKLDGFIARKAPVFAEQDILGFARTIGVHPGLVAGQIQRKTGKYDRFRNHLVKVRHHIAPSAVVDGWGVVAPVGI